MQDHPTLNQAESTDARRAMTLRGEDSSQPGRCQPKILDRRGGQKIPLCSIAGSSATSRDERVQAAVFEVW
jgi:hypothetical protein